MDTTLPDIVAPNLAVLFCGINPGILAATTGHHFAGRGNRFWRTIHLAGFTPEEIRPENHQQILEYGYGLTSFVGRATASANELTGDDFIFSAIAFKKKIHHYSPHFVAFLGKAAYAALSGQRDIAWGLQSTHLGNSLVWILPNPSGRNRAFSLERLVDAYRQLHVVARKTIP